MADIRHPAYSQATCNLQFDVSSDILQSRNKDDVLATWKYSAASHSQMITRDPPLPLKTLSKLYVDNVVVPTPVMSPVKDG